MNSEWIMCPICGNKTRDKIREDTELKNFPLYCPKCKQESLIDAKNLQVDIFHIVRIGGGDRVSHLGVVFRIEQITVVI